MLEQMKMSWSYRFRSLNQLKKQSLLLVLSIAIDLQLQGRLLQKKIILFRRLRPKESHSLKAGTKAYNKHSPAILLMEQESNQFNSSSIRNSSINRFQRKNQDRKNSLQRSFQKWLSFRIRTLRTSSRKSIR